MNFSKLLPALEAAVDVTVSTVWVAEREDAEHRNQDSQIHT